MYKKQFNLNLLFIVLLCVIVGNAFASDPEDQETLTVGAAMKSSLKLTNTQVKEVLPILKEYFKQILDMKRDVVDKSELPMRIKFLRDDLDSNLSHYLTEQQMASWKKQLPEGDGRNETVQSKSSVSEMQENSTIPTDEVLESGNSNKTKTSGIW